MLLHSALPVLFFGVLHLSPPFLEAPEAFVTASSFPRNNFRCLPAVRRHPPWWVFALPYALSLSCDCFTIPFQIVVSSVRVCLVEMFYDFSCHFFCSTMLCIGIVLGLGRKLLKGRTDARQSSTLCASAPAQIKTSRAEHINIIGQQPESLISQLKHTVHTSQLSSMK